MSSIGYIRHEMYNNESCKRFTTTKLKTKKKRKKKSKQAAEVKLRLKILKFFFPHPQINPNRREATKISPYGLYPSCCGSILRLRSACSEI